MRRHDPLEITARVEKWLRARALTLTVETVVRALIGLGYVREPLPKLQPIVKIGVDAARRSE